MPIRSISGTPFTYHLIAFNKDGRERKDDPDGRMSERAGETIRTTPVTDVFIASHGWKGDVPAADEQYTRWIRAMLACSADRQRIRERRREFTPFIVGFHWPSLPFGDEELGRRRAAFGEESAGSPSVDALVDAYAERLEDTPVVRSALRTILEAAVAGEAPEELPPEVREAYLTIDRALNLRSDGLAGGPGGDREPFDPDRAYKSGLGAPATTFGGGSAGDALLGPLRQLSFWKMKDRAREVGESGGANLLKALQAAAPAGRDVRFHLMGHSFGCIVMSSMLKGRTSADRPDPVHSVALVQGALSLWSYASDLPDEAGKRGYFHDIITGRMVKGPLIATLSRHDTAVGKLYPAAAGISRQVAFGLGDLPKYGAVGAFGVRNTGSAVENVAMKPLEEGYGFAAGGVYNLESSSYICEGSGFSGAHNDISKPEVAHAVWEAAMS